MHIAIFGLGYVGSVSAACLAHNGHHVIGVDTKPEKVERINAGLSPIIEPELDELIRTGVEQGRITATHVTAEALERAEVALVCVGTPSQPNGSLDLSYVERVCHEIGQVLATRDAYCVVAIRSTVLPGSVERVIIPALEATSGKRAGDDFGFGINPEFLREGSAVRDFYQPPYTVIGEMDARSGAVLAQLYQGIAAPLHRVGLGTAEMIKYANNAFHALKVVFANEMGNIAQMYGVDSHEVMEVFVQDTKLNLSPYYLRPGFAFGGSCLPKDLRALLYAARQRDVVVPMLDTILDSNRRHLEKALDLILNQGRRRVGVIGLSFKTNTDDLRESPAVELLERLIGKGYAPLVYDREVSLSSLHGSNQAYLEQTIPHIVSLMRTSLSDIIAHSEVVVVTKRLSATEAAQLHEGIAPEQILIDLVRLDPKLVQQVKGQYFGICW
jgi:GDP-mannose 6-dehydrogenase